MKSLSFYQLENMLAVQLRATQRVSMARFILGARRMQSTQPGQKASGETENIPAKKPEQKVTVAVTEKKSTLWDKVKHEAHHYWSGTKLLGMEIKVSSRLLLKMTSGYELTRREYRQLQRTTVDMLKVVPFAMFVIIPFAELLLPVALKLFPGLLPSTFESNVDKEKKLKILRNSRYKVADLLKNSKEMVSKKSSTSEEELKQFNDFLAKLNSKDNVIPTGQLVRVAKMFKDDLILDNVSRGVLIAMAKYINLRPYGTDQILRYRIRHKMLKIKEDDKLIQYEGIDSLSTAELQQACAIRGIRVFNATPGQMKHWLSEWLNLRLNERVPSTLILLTNAHMYGETEIYSSYPEALKAVLSTLPIEIYHETVLNVDKDATPAQKLEVLKEQENLIQSEVSQEADHKVLVKDKLSLDDEPVKEEEQKK